MNTNIDFLGVNTILGSFFTASEDSHEFICSEEEKNWMGRALETIKNPEKGIKLQENISYQVGTLCSFTPDQIVRLVSLWVQGLKREPDSQEATNYLCQKAAALFIKKDVHSFENFLQKSSEKNFAIQVMIQRVRESKLLPLDAVKGLQRYGIDPRSPEGQKALVEIAKLAAQQDGWRTSENIKNYGIEASSPKGRQALIEIAKLAAQQNGWGTSEFIKNYGIDPSPPESRQALIEIAKLAAQQSGFGISRYIKNYSIDASTLEGRQALIEIAKLAAQKDGWGTSKHIKNYSIDTSTPKGRQALKEIAQLAAQQNGGGTSENIKNYGFDASTPEGRQAQIAVAKLAAQQSGVGTSAYIKNYGFEASTPEGRQALIEVAKLAAQQSGLGTSAYIKYYGLEAATPEGRQALIEIAKLAAQQDGGGTSRFIKNYGLKASIPKDRQVLIEIAKLAAQQDGRGTSLYIEEYGLKGSTPEGRQALIEIAKLAAQQNAKGTLEYFYLYPLEKVSAEGKRRFEDLSNFLFICLVKQFAPFSYSAYKDTFKAYAAQLNGNGRESYRVGLALFDPPLDKLKAHDREGALKDCLQLGTTLFGMDLKDLQWVQNSFSKADKEAIQTEFLEGWMSLASLCASREDLKRLFRENQSLFERMSTLSPDLRTTLTQEIIASSLEKKGLFLDALKAVLFKEHSLVKKIAVLPHDLRVAVTEVFIRGCQGQHAEMWENMNKETEDIAHARLACLTLSQYPKGDYTAVLAKIKSDRNLRDAKYQQPLLETLLAIKYCSLKDASKIDLLNKIFALPDMERLTGFRLVVDILNFKGEAYLREITDFQDLKSAVEKLFADKCKVQLDNFTALYENTVGTWRSKDALLTYAGKHAANPAVLPYFQAFLSSVLKDNFQTIRYATDNNPHLAEIEQHHPQVFENWRLPAALKDDEVSLKDTDKAIPIEKRVIETLKQAVENRHLGLERQEALFPILAACQGKWELMDNPMDLIAQQLDPLRNRRLSEEEKELKQRLLLQKSLLELIQDSGDLVKKLNILKGIKIKGLDEALSPFYSDLEDAVKFMHSSGQPKAEAYRVIDTDDPNHFLLMGTEVLNSCQDVKGSASLNVGLLGYALDGKHRLALVCDPEGKILARSVLRLLLDSEGKPVIFQEKMYVADANPAYPQLLRQIALKKAGLLGVPLVVSPADFEKEQAKKYPLSIQAKAKRIPFEYVDALGGLHSGPYIIGNALHIHPKR